MVHSVRRVLPPKASSSHRISKPPHLYSSTLGASAPVTFVSVTCCVGAIHSHGLSKSAFASLRKNFLRVATAMQEAGMQHGSLIRSGRKRGPNVWQFRWAGRRPYEKRVCRKRVIGTVCQYPDQDSARQSVTVLLREINRHALQRIGTTLLE